MMQLITRMPAAPTFRVKLPHGMEAHNLKFAVRGAAKENPLYFERVELLIPVETEVEVSNFGRWLFGVKGFAGHWKNSPAENGWVTVNLPDVPEAKELVERALRRLKIEFEEV